MATSTNIVFPNIINVVLNDSLSNFMSLTTVSPAVSGTFTFRKTNSSGSILTTSSLYDAVGAFTVYCSFVPTNTGAYSSSNATITLSVADKDVFNNYFNIPVTDPNNVLVNGDFNYIPSSITTGTSAIYESGSTSSTVPGWYFSNYYLVPGNGTTGYSGGPWTSRIYNNVDLGGAIAFPYPFGTVCLRLSTSVYQFFYCVAGTYTLKLYVAIPTVQSNSTAGVYIDKNTTLLLNFVTSGPNVGTGMLNAGWQQVVTTFTVATTGMHSLLLQYSAGDAFYIGNVSITPAATNPIYLRFSKINSLITNGTFETQVASANSKTNIAIANWTTVSGSAWTLNNYSTDLKIPIPYPSGNQCVALESTAKITHTFTSTASTSNFLSFYVCGGLNDASMNNLKVTVNSTLICDISNFGFRTGGWSKQIYSGITTVSGENTLIFEGGTPFAGYITAIDNVIFGQVTKEARPITFVSPTNYQFLPLQNETMNSNTYNATQPGSLTGSYQCTASSNRVVSNPSADIYHLFTNDPSTYYHSSDPSSTTPKYYSLAYAINGIYVGATDINGSLTYFWTTNVVNVGTISGEWVQIKLPSPIRLTRYGLRGRNGVSQRFPLDYYVLGSNDGSTWYSIKSVTNSPVPTWPNIQYVDVPENTQAYSFYRLVCTRIGSNIESHPLNLGKFYLFGDNSKTYYGNPLGSRLTATTDISGTFTYYTDASYNNRIYPDSTLPASNYTLYSVFTPTDTIDYIPSYANTSLSIIASNPQIVFPKMINVVLNDTLADFISRVTISPVVAGTFIFQKTNSSGPIITSSSVYDAVGTYTIFCTFVPTDQVTYNTSSSTITLSVLDKDLFNNYFNVPVTDPNNMLVNGNFDYIPSSITSGTSAYYSGTNYANVPGWSITTLRIFNNVDLSYGIAFPYPFGTKCVGDSGFFLYQYFYGVAGTYTLSFYGTVKTVYTTSYYVSMNLDNVRIMNLNGSTTGQIPVGWQKYSVNFTIATTGMHKFDILYNGGGNGFYLGNISITPVNNFTYLKPSKINSLIANGMFDAVAASANSKTNTTISSWNIISGNVWTLNNFSSYTAIPQPYPSGNQCIAIEALGKVTQTFTTTASSSNFLSFYACGVSDASINALRFSINGTVIADMSTNMFRSTAWSKVIYSGITTVSGENTLTIEGLTSTTGFISAIDNVVFGQVTKETRPITMTPQTNGGGTPLAANLTATTDISGTFAYYRDASYNIPVTAATTLPIGNYTLYTVFTPADTVDYNVAYASTSLAVIVQVIFPNVIYVVMNETLADFISRTTASYGIPGTFTFRKNNSSGAIITSSNIYDAVGPYTIFCSFVPTNTVAYNSCDATMTVSVLDKDVFNNYFNVPVTDPNNMLVNGNFEYIPSSIGVGTSSTNLINLPGWTSNVNVNILYNNVDLSNNNGLTSLPYPFGTKCLRLKTYMFQMFYCVAGTYRFSMYLGATALPPVGNWIQVYIDGNNTQTTILSTYGDIQQGWQIKTVDFTIATTGMHYILFNYFGTSVFYIGNISIKPINNITYLKPSRINSLITNGTFDAVAASANSITNTIIPNWNIINGNVWTLNNFSSYTLIPSPYPSGNQCIAIESLGKIMQTFTATASSSNFLSFYACAISDASINGLQLTINNTVISDPTKLIFRSGTWTKVIYGGITTMSGTNTLTIEGLNAGYITAIDNVVFGQVTKETRPITISPQSNKGGTPLAANLTATTDISGTFAYYRDASYNIPVTAATTLAVGNYTLYTVFTPADTVDYNVAYANTSLQVIVQVIFPNVFNVVLNDTLASFISGTTASYGIAGTFTFRKNNSSGAIITSSNIYDAVGAYTIYCSFVPTDAVTYNSCDATIILNVQDKDLFNNYFNIPVTNSTNVLVNGDFNYIPSSIGVGTMVSTPANVPGWTFYKYSAYDIHLVNNMDVSAGITFPPPFASTTTKVIYFTGGYLFQWFYANAGTYQFSVYYAAPSVSTNYIYIGIDTLASATIRSSTQYPNLQNWQFYTQTVTISTTGMHRFMMTTNGNSKFYAANLSLTPISNPIYLRFSKISSKIFNGAFETDVQTANSMTLAPLTNWTTVTGNIWVLNNYTPYLSTLPYPYPSGNQCIVVGGLGKITQTFTYVASSVNYLSFYMCSINDVSANGIRVTVNSTAILEISSNNLITSASSLNRGSWQKMLFSGITTVAGPNTLIIEGLKDGNFFTAIDSVIFGQVTKETRPITFNNQHTTYYGLPLATSLNATTDISGTFAYYLDEAYTNQVYADSTLPVGSYTLYAVFSPIDTIDYNIAYANASLTVIMPNPQIIFPNDINEVLNDTLADFMSRVTVSPAVPGTFTFRNAGAIITSSSVYNAVGPYTISCTFVPTNLDTKFYVVWHSGVYNVQSFTTLAEATTSYNSIANHFSRALFNPSQNVVQSWYFDDAWRQGILTYYLSVVGYVTSSSAYTVYVLDKDVFNNYFNIPVTDPNNMLVNGNFDYIPSTIASGTFSTNLINLPGWNVTFNTLTQLFNNFDLSNNNGLTSLPYPFGTKCIRLRSAIYQFFYCVAGTYTFRAYLGAPVTTPGSEYIQVNIDMTRILATAANQGWQVITTNFTIATPGMHYLYLNYNGPSTFFLGNISIKPVNNFTYLKPSKISSLILNGVFETEIKTANSRSLTPITNWTVVDNNVWVLNNFSSYTAIPQPYPSGNQCIAIEALGKVTQTFTTTASSSNFLSFYACAISDSSINTLRFSINSTVIADMSTNMFRSGTWSKVIYGGITTVSGENTLTIQGRTPTAGFISAIDNVVFGQVTKEARPVTFVSPTNYQFLPLRNETITSNTYNAVQHGSLNGRYECTASSNRVLGGVDAADIYRLFTNDLSTYYHTSDVFDGTPKYYSNNSYSATGNYIGSKDICGNLAYFWTTNVVNVGTISGEWVQIKLPSPIQLTNYGLLGRNALPQRFPLDYYVLGSNDGSTWYSINSVTNSQVPTWPNIQYVDVSNNRQMYLFYRLVCTRIGSDNIYNTRQWNLSKFALFGDNSKTNYGTPLGSTLTATTDISGSYTYYLDASYNDRVYPDSTLPAGNYNLYTVFNPSDTVNYIPSYGNRSFSVVLPNPQIVFPKIINVLLNETLSYFMATTTVSPAIAGTFTFRKTNSSGTVLTSSSVYDVVGDYVIFCTFVPSDSANYSTAVSTFELHVQDKEAYNNYYNIPVTDLSNILVNGSLNYFSSTYLPGTITSNANTFPGWNVGANQFFNDYNFSSVGATYPAPFGSSVFRLINATMQQPFYAIAGTYTASFTYFNNFSLPTNYFRFYVDGVTIGTQFLGTLTDWTQYSVNFTIATTGMHEFQIYSGTNNAYFGNIKIVPSSVATNISFLKFSKIDSQVFNGTFESEIKTANSRVLNAPLANWNIVTSGVWLLNNFTTLWGTPYPSGNQCVLIEGLGKITQTFNYIDSSFNYLSFYLNTPAFDNSRNPIVVKLNNTVIYNPSYLTFKCYTWSKQIVTNITTVAGQNTLSIEGTDASFNGKITMLDNVVFGSIARTPSITTYTLPANTTIQYGTPLAQLLIATCNAAATITYFIDSAYTNQVYADSTLPVGSYQMYVKSTRIDIYNFDSDSTAGPQSFSVIMPNPQIIFPNDINEVLNETLADFMSRVTVSPVVPGTFTFRNAGAIITPSSVYNAVGPYTISCTFVPTDAVTYTTSSSTYTVYVQDIDTFNHYFNVPVTDPSNLIVNGNFNYIPSSIGVGTSSTSLTNVPGWSITYNASTILYNNVDLSYGITFPYPFGTKCLRINSYVYQYFYCIAGTYTFSCHIAVPTVYGTSSWVSVLIDTTQIGGMNNPTQLAVGWQPFSVNFTIATTGMHYLRLYNNNTAQFYLQNISIKPVTNPIATYVRFSKINSLISNGVFETEIKTANSRSLTPITNWTVVNNNVWILNNFSSYSTIPQPYPSGNQCIAIETLGKITQTFTATASSSNFLSFYACGISDTALNTLRFSINGTTIADMNTNMFRSGTWTKVIYGGITTVNGTNTLTIEGIISTAGFISAIDNVIFGQVTKETRPFSFVSPTDYQFLPLRNETMTSNTYNAVQHGSLNGSYECTASSSAAFQNSDIYYLFDTNPSTNYSTSYVTGGNPLYYSWPYANNGFYSGANDASGTLAYFFKTSVVNVGTVSGEWIQVKLPSPIRLTRYGLAPREQNGHRFPLDYYVLGSNDGSIWYSIKSVTNSQIPTWPNTQYVDVSNNTQMYMFYRIVCTRVTRYGPDYNMWNFSQFALFGDNSKTYYGTPLGSTLNATTDISGSYTYYLDASYNDRVYPDSTLPVGNYNLYTVFTPFDAVDYTPLYGNRSLTVEMPNSQIVFPKIINVVLNDTLSYFMATTTVSPAIAGTFTFRKTNSSGSVLTSSSVYDAVGDYFIYCTFVPTDSTTYSTIASTFEVSVQDKDAYNNYYNIPVTDLSNILINGNFTYLPSNYLYGTEILNPMNVPGWRFDTNSYLRNGLARAGTTFPPPFGNVVVRVSSASARIRQSFFCVAGTYTFSMMYSNTASTPTVTLSVIFDFAFATSITLGTMNDWQLLTGTVTLTHGMHEMAILTSSSSNGVYFGNIKLVPTSVVNNISFMKFSKIESQVFNGSFESEIRTANSLILDAPLANWSIATSGVWLLNNYALYTRIPIPYPSGNQCIGIAGLGKVTQTFNYIDSSLNYLSFYMAAQSDTSRNRIIVKMNNNTVFSYVASAYAFYNDVWTKTIITNITTVAGLNTLSIEGRDINTMTIIDNVVFGSVTRSPTSTTYTLPANTVIKYGVPVVPLMTATCSIPANITYYIDSAYTNQVYADSTLPIGNYQMYVLSTPLDIYNYQNSLAGPQSFSVVSPNPAIVFPKMINVVLNDQLANFINYTTVSPAIAGTFVFQLNNSSGATLTTSSTYNVVGKFTIFCTFTPIDTVTYETTSATYSVTVEDNDAPNNYFNIPVTDTTNLLVNGNFEYIPSTYPPGTQTSNQPSATASNIPGWRFWTIHTSSYTRFINDVNISGLSYPFPYGPKCAQLRGGNIYQMVYLNAGTYTFSAYFGVVPRNLTNSYTRFSIDGKGIGSLNGSQKTTTDWEYYSVNFTVSATKSYEFMIGGAGSPSWYVQKMSIVPTSPNPVYLKFSKIDTQIFNGSFETEIKTANSKFIVPLTNWSTERSTVWVLNSFTSYAAIPLPYPSGNQCIAIETAGKISQTFTYTASNLNYLSFYICGDASTNPITFKLNDILICTITPFSAVGGTWQKCIYPNLTTVAGTNTLTIEGTNYVARGLVGIDNVILGQVNRATPTLTFPTPSPIVYGTDLSFVLVASCVTPGSFKYYIDVNYSTQVYTDTKLIPNMYSIYAIYTPNDQVNYTQSFAAVDLSVNKVIPSLQYATPAPISFGTLLESSLTATTNILGKIDYYSDAALTTQVNTLTVLNPGTYTIYAKLTPTDLVVYSLLTTSATLVVNSTGSFVPTMTYPSLSSITYGSNLTNKLNASVLPNIPGSIRYYTDASFNTEVTTYTVLLPGLYTIYARFVPTDPNQSSQVSKSVSLFVNNLSIETRKLVLNTRDISSSTVADDYFNTTVTTSAGTVENNRYTHTWNTNIRSVMGDDFYNRYSKFSIKLKEFVNDGLFTTIQDASQNLSLYWEVYNECKLSGIQFDPLPYENGSSSNAATMGLLTRQFPASNPCYHNLVNGNGSTYTFSKTTDTVPVKIDLPNLYDDGYFAPATNAILFGHLTFVFEIRGVLI